MPFDGLPILAIYQNLGPIPGVSVAWALIPRRLSAFERFIGLIGKILGRVYLFAYVHLRISQICSLITFVSIYHRSEQGFSRVRVISKELFTSEWA